MTNACTAFGWEPGKVLHEMGMGEVFAMLACHAWGQGMEPAAETYEDREVNAILAKP